MIKRSNQKVVTEALRMDYVVKSEQERGPGQMIYKQNKTKQRGQKRRTMLAGCHDSRNKKDSEQRLSLLTNLKSF